MSHRTLPILILAIAALLWLATGAALSTRTYFVFNYDSIASLPPHLEVIGASLPVMAALIGLSALIAVLYMRCLNGTPEALNSARPNLFITIGLCLASLPLAKVVMLAMQATSSTQAQQTYWWEPIIYAIFSGLALGIPLELALGHNTGKKLNPPSLTNTKNFSPAASPFPLFLLATVTFTCCCWWIWQSLSYYNDFQLGFNDFGHFLLRVVNTSRFDGFLKETDVLPPFWDHFNPGLVLLVPFWWAAPNPIWIFIFQASALALSGLIIYAIARKHGAREIPAMLWGLAWLSYPSIGQMNLAYTYGWHPITFAIPALLGAYFCFIAKRPVWAAILAMLACSFEEGPVAAIACFAASEALRSLWLTKTDRRQNTIQTTTTETNTLQKSHHLSNAKGWGALWLSSTIVFVLIYKFSGLAEFQTGRFARLGDGPIDILLSPLVRTNVWIDLLFRERNGAFLAFLFAPFILSIVSIWPRSTNPTRYSFFWTILASAPLFMVLLLWEHLPAQSLAFQYASVILPVLFAGAIRASHDPVTSSPSEAPSPRNIFADTSAYSPASTWIAGFVLSCFVGQFPWTTDTLLDVKSRAYGPLSFATDGYTPESKTTRRVGNTDNAVFHDQIRDLRQRGIRKGQSPDQLAFEQISILATGRLASHLLGCKDLETVGQFEQRRNDYQKLRPELASPLLRFDAIAIDPIEAFQQTPEESSKVRQEAIQLGFSIERIPNGFELWIAPK